MRGLLVSCFVLLFFLTPVHGIISNVQITDKGSVVIAELDNPAIFDFEITNKDEPERVEIYSFVGISFAPKGFFDVRNGTEQIRIHAFPDEHVRTRRGNYRFTYYIKGNSQKIFSDSLSIRIVPLESVLDFEAFPLSPNNELAIIKVTNKENTHIEQLPITFSSEFFSHTEQLTLEPFATRNISVPVSLHAVRGITAGPYLFEIQAQAKNTIIEAKGIIELLEKESVSLEKFTEGTFIRTVTIVKTNEGNTPLTVRVSNTQNIFSRLFTLHSPDPVSRSRDGLSVTYVWEKEILPGESLLARSQVNYLTPFGIVALILLLAFFVRYYSLRTLTLNKKVSFVHTKGGEFALKVNVRIKARRHVDNVDLIDRLPPMAHIYEKFGRKPDSVDPNTRRIFWHIDRLQKGEERVFSYIIYSKIKILGRLVLPTAHAKYTREGKSLEVRSNRAYFATGSHA